MEALEGSAVADGAGDLLLRGWDTERLGELRDRLGGRLVERTVDLAEALKTKLRAADDFELAEERFGISVHRRSIERALARQEKKRR